MRFRIARKWRDVYHFHFSETTITFQYPRVRRQVSHGERLIWSWPGGGRYSLVIPFRSRTSVAYIDSEEGRICTGRGVSLALRRATGQQKSFPIVEWEFSDGMVVVCEGGALCCQRIPRTWTLRQVGGRRLAFWLPRGGCYAGACRKSIGERDLPVIAGMIVAQFHDAT